MGKSMLLKKGFIIENKFEKSELIWFKVIGNSS